ADAGEGVSTLDAVYVLQALAGLRTFSSSQRLACDVTGDGTLSALDAVRILQYKVGLISTLPVADTCASDWVFVPASAGANAQVVEPAVSSGSCQTGAVEFQPLTGTLTNQDFSAVLFGDCTGN